MSERPPSFLVFITDQHRPDHTGFGGNTIVRTPHLDSIAARGVRFDRALVANPICMPNRSTIVTGVMPSVHGTRINGIPLDWGANTFARVMRERGYHNAYFGKSHLQNMGNNRAIAERIYEGTPECDARRREYGDGWDAWEDQARHRRERVRMPDDFYGFEEVDLVVEHSDLGSGHYYQWLLEQGVDPTRLQGPKNALEYAPRTPLQVWRTAMPEELYPTHYVSMRTAEFLERRRGFEQPFLAVCSYPDPHHPFTPPGRYFDLYDPEKIPLPETFGDAHTDSMPHLQRMLGRRGEQGFVMAPFAPTPEQFREMAGLEYGMISMIDDGVGRVLQALERSGHAENTIVVFTSDHGDMFGDHSLMLKAGMHYEGCIRVPLVIAIPGRPPAVCGSLASSLDLAQTFLELAGCPEYAGMQGTSLAPLLDDPSSSVRDHVLVEEDQMFDIARVGQPLRMRTLVTEEARLTLYEGSDEGELFDLEKDPKELHNLFGRSEARALRAEIAERLARLQMTYADRGLRPGAMA